MSLTTCQMGSTYLNTSTNQVHIEQSSFERIQCRWIFLELHCEPTCAKKSHQPYIRFDISDFDSTIAWDTHKHDIDGPKSEHIHALANLILKIQCDGFSFVRQPASVSQQLLSHEHPTLNKNTSLNIKFWRQRMEPPMFANTSQH
jgi:hypothetical protein